MTCLATTPPACSGDILSTPQNTTLIVPAASLKAYKSTSPWSNFGTIKSDESCDEPSITIENGTLEITCATEGAKCYYTIVADDEASDKEPAFGEVTLTGCYRISAYAAFEGGIEETKSPVATATLCWIAPGETPAGATVLENLRGVLVTSSGGTVKVQGLNSTEEITWEETDGVIHTVKATDGIATFSAQAGSTITVRTGNASFKVLVK